MKGADSYMEIILMAFPKKSCLGLIGHLKPKMAHPHNPGSAVGIVLQCCAVKGASRDIEVVLMVFLKKILFWGNLVILAQKWYILITLDLLSGFFKNFAQ